MKIIQSKFKLSLSKFKLTPCIFSLCALLSQIVGAQQVAVTSEATLSAEGLLPTSLWELRDSTERHEVQLSVELPCGNAPEAFVRLLEGKFGVFAAGLLREWSGDEAGLCDTVRVTDNTSFMAFFDKVVDCVDSEVRAAAEVMTEAGLAAGTATLDYRLTAEWPGMATFGMNAYNYHPGAAHGMSVSYSETYDVQTLEAFSLAHFADTLALKRLVCEALTESFEDPLEQVLFEPVDPASPDFGCAFPLPQAAPFLTAGGVAFVYQPYEIAPFAFGLPMAVVPYADALQCASPEGRRWIERAMQATGSED
ncbi:MAG: DUF3298 domain-containing protein [Prevotellaceae bacterium]|nr:DUF3298 domain-containing protein [Prevotellaceae bacterium]